MKIDQKEISHSSNINSKNNGETQTQTTSTQKHENIPNTYAIEKQVTLLPNKHDNAINNSENELVTNIHFIEMNTSQVPSHNNDLHTHTNIGNLD